MATIALRNESDVAKARNLLRKLIVGQRWPLNLCAKATAVVAVLSETVLISDTSAVLEIMVIPQAGKRGVELKCDIRANEKQHPQVAELCNQLRFIANDLTTNHTQGILTITARLWS